MAATTVNSDITWWIALRSCQVWCARVSVAWFDEKDESVKHQALLQRNGRWVTPPFSNVNGILIGIIEYWAGEAQVKEDCRVVTQLKCKKFRSRIISRRNFSDWWIDGAESIRFALATFAIMYTYDVTNQCTKWPINMSLIGYYVQKVILCTEN